MSSAVLKRTRTRISAVGTSVVQAAVVGAPRSGIIRRVRCTIDPNMDGQASFGTGPSLDVRLDIGEGVSASGLGGVLERAKVAEYALTPLAPSRTIDDPPDVFYQLQPGQSLRLFVATDQNAVGFPGTGDAVVVVTLDIELTNLER